MTSAQFHTFKPALLVLALLLLPFAAHSYYNAETGRWLNRDPAGEQGGLNEFAACDNSLVDRSDSLGLSVYQAQGDLLVFPGRPPITVRYPRKGPFQCCRNKTIGSVTPLKVIVDGSRTTSLQEQETILYEQIVNSFPLLQLATSQLNLPAYIGGGPYLKFEKTWEGKICCPNHTWKQTIVGSGKEDGTFRDKTHYFDYAGTPPKTDPGQAENSYRLQLYCHRGGYSFQVWEMYWSYTAVWQVATPRSTVTVTVPW